MVKKSRSIYIIGSMIIGLAAIFLVYFLLIMTGVIMVKNENLIISSGSVEAIYNGQEIKCEEIEIIDGQLSKGHKIEAIFTGKLTNVGVTDNAYDYKIVDSQGVNVTDNYIVKKLEGKITVNKRPIKIRATDASKMYDGKPLTASSAGYKILDGNLVEGHKLEVSPYGEITNAGTGFNQLKYTIYDSSGNTVTGNYDVVVEEGILTVTQIPLVITSSDASKKFDGTPLIKDECHITLGELIDYDGDGVSDHKLVTKTISSITEPGEIKNEFEYVIYDIHTDEEVTDNYDIEPVYGSLKVMSNELIFICEDVEMEYNGQPCPKNLIKIEPSSETQAIIDENNYTYEVKMEEIKGVDYGKYNIVYTVDIFNAEGEDITEYCNIVSTPGKLSILKKQITIETKADNVIYNGKPYYTVDSNFEDIIVSGQTIDLGETTETIEIVKYNLEIIDVNGYENIVEYKIIKADGTDSTANYSVKPKNGNIIITQKELKVITPEINVEYSGEFPELDTSAYVAEGLCEGHNIDYEMQDYTLGDYLKVVNSYGNLMNKPKSITITDGEKDVTKNYKLIEKGYSVITLQKRDVSIASKSKTKTYDGLELINNSIDLTFDGEIISGTSEKDSNYIELEFFSGHKVEIEFTAREPFINAGVIKNNFTYKIYNGELDVTSLFNVNNPIGSLTIKPRYVLVSTKNVEKEYNGELQSGKNSGLYVSCGEGPNVPTATSPSHGNSIDLGNGNYLVVSDSWTEISIGYIINKPLSYVICKQNGEIETSVLANNVQQPDKVSANFIIEEEFGYLSIYRDDYDFTFVIDSVSYGSYIFDSFPDGVTMEALVEAGWSNGYYCYQDTSMFSKIVPTYTIKGTEVINEVGYYEVSMKVKLFDADGNDVTNDYDIDYIDGYIKIYETLLYVISEDFSKTYDGTPLVDEKGAYLLNASELKEGHEFRITNEDKNSIIDAGSMYNSYSYKIVDTNNGDEDVTDQYGFDVSWGYLTISKRQVSLQFDDFNSDNAIEVLEGVNFLTEQDITITGIEQSVGNSTGLLEGHVATNVTFVTQTFEDLEVDEYRNVGIEKINFTVIVDGKDVSSNYDFVSDLRIEVVRKTEEVGM